MNKLVPGLSVDFRTVIDTLVISRLLNFNREGGHSLERYGDELGFPKIHFKDFSKLTPEMETYMEQDIRLGHKVYEMYKDYIFSERWREALRTEHDTAWYCRQMHENGFSYDKEASDELLLKINTELAELDEVIQKSFPPRSRLIREITPTLTKHGTFHKKDFKWYDGTDLSPFTPGAPFSLIEFKAFNAGSAPQRIERLNEAGWKPFEKTKSHIQAERDYNRAKTAENKERLDRLRKTGWVVSEENLATLPPDAPEGAKALARRILLDSRRGDLEEWVAAYDPNDGRVHGDYLPIGAWTQRAAHRNPNTANIATGDSLFAHEMRSLWRAAPGNQLIGVDADGIQLRIFAHYCRDDRLVEAILRGDKATKTDIHSLNQQALGEVCRSRDDAKTYIYAFLLGAGDAKLASVLGCSLKEAKEARKNFLNAYPGLRLLKQKVIPSDAERGYFEGFDGRLVLCDSEHLMLAGYLQNGESVVMKKAMCIWVPEFQKRGFDFRLVNWVHDEYVTETKEKIEVSAEMAKLQADAIAEVGDLYKLYCPLAGSHLNPKTGGPMVGSTWYDVH